MSTEQPAVDVPAHVLEYLSQQSTLTLATASPTGVPRASTFLYVNDGPNLFFWTRAGHHDRPADRAEPGRVVCDRRVRAGPRPDQGRTGQRRVLGDPERRADRAGGRPVRAEVPRSLARRDPEHLLLPDRPDRARVHRQRRRGRGRAEGTFGAEFHREQQLQHLRRPAGVQTPTSHGNAPVDHRRAGRGDRARGRARPTSSSSWSRARWRSCAGRSGGEVAVQAGPGDLFGEMAIMRDRPRTATVRAAAPTRLLAMEHDTFRDARGAGARHDRRVRPGHPRRLESLGTGG